MAQGMRFMAEDQGDVCVLFSYICGFDEILNHLGKNIVDFLDNLFRHFDKICVHHGVQKIEVLLATRSLTTSRLWATPTWHAQVLSPPKRICHLNFERLQRPFVY
jgi:phospholipid-translocating ATPase